MRSLGLYRNEIDTFLNSDFNGKNHKLMPHSRYFSTGQNFWGKVISDFY